MYTDAGIGLSYLGTIPSSKESFSNEQSWIKIANGGTKSYFDEEIHGTDYYEMKTFVTEQFLIEKYETLTFLGRHIKGRTFAIRKIEGGTFFDRINEEVLPKWR